jgi:hypothetical protein
LQSTPDDKILDYLLIEALFLGPNKLPDQSGAKVRIRQLAIVDTLSALAVA